MRHRIRWIGTALIVCVAGCSQGPSTDTAGADSKTASPATAAPGAAGTDKTSTPGTSAPTDQVAQPGGSLNEGPPAGAAPSPSAANSTTPPTPAAGVPDATAGAPADDWLAGIDNGQLTGAYAQMRQRLQADANDVDAHLNVIFILQNVARMRTDMGDADKAYATFAASAKEARALLASGNEIPPAAGRLFSNVFYNDACACSRANDTQAALSAIEEALKWGFNDFAMLKSDEDLVAVRGLPDFDAKLAGWESAAAEAHKAKVVEELAAFQSFPFEFEVTDVDGMAHKLADYKGKVLIVDIWGTWCPPCRAELPSFIKLQQSFGEQGFQMIGLNYEGQTDAETAAKVKTFMTENGINYPCALGADPTRDQVPDFEGYPTTLFIDRSGKVRLKAVGLHEYAYLEAIVTTLLAEGGQ